MKATAIAELLFENRARSRVKLNLVCQVLQDGVVLRGPGWQTLDMSKDGISIRWSDQYPPPGVGDRLTIEVGLPRHPRFGAKCLFFEAEVVRVARRADDSTLVAAKSHKSGFRRPSAWARFVN